MKKTELTVRGRLNTDRSDRIFQPITVGIDPGSKEECITIKSPTKTYTRRSRRQRKIPCRKCRGNRKGRGIPPSTKARWDGKRISLHDVIDGERGRG